MPTVTFALHPAAAKSLIARAVASLPQVQSALRSGKIFVGHGTTNIAVAEALTGLKVQSPREYVAGVITQKVACSTDKKLRRQPWCLDKGKPVETEWLDFINSFQGGDIFIKGANAVDPFGRAGILLADDCGGTIGRSIGILRARGIELIIPVGLEKMIPSCTTAQKGLGIENTGLRLGLPVGYMVLDNITLITEIESLKILYDVEAAMIAGGGVGGMEGSVVLAAECTSEENARTLLRDIKGFNRQKPISIDKSPCKECLNPCELLHR